MAGSVFYTQEARHPDAKALPAYLIFAATFSVCFFGLLEAMLYLLRRFDLEGAVADPGVALLLLLTAFLPAFLVARWQLRKPPRRAANPAQVNNPTK